MILALCYDRFPQQIANRYDGNDIAAVDHRQMANFVLMHQSQAIDVSVRGINGDDITCHDVRDGGGLQRLFGKDGPASAIALGDDADQPSLIENHDQADVFIDHRLQRSQNGIGGASGPQFLGF